MNQIIKFFIDNYKLTLILSLGLMIFGIMGLFSIRSESYPSVNFAMVTVETRYEGATASDVETKITKPIEDEIKGVSGLKDVRSVSKTGHSNIFIRVDMDNVDVEPVINDLQKAVERVSSLPPDLRDPPKFKEINSEEFPAIEIAVIGDNANRSRDKIVDLLKEELEDNKGVLSAREVGHAKRRFNIRPNLDKLASFHFGVNEIINRLSLRNISVPGGEIKSDDQRKLIRVDAKIQNKEELEAVVIRSNFSGKKILLSDVAMVEDGSEDHNVFASYNYRPATLLVVTKKAGADTIKLVDEVESIILRFKNQFKDYEFNIYNNEGKKVKNRLKILSGNANSGLILVFVFLLIFLPWRTGVVASLSLPICILTALGFMKMFGMNLDAITILALVIALGMLVDNSVVISENFNRLKNDGLSSGEAAFESVSQLWLPITATCFTTIAAFLPMLVTKGIMGEFIKYIPIIVCISLMVSLGESFFLLPTRLILIEKFKFNKTKKIEETKTSDWFDKIISKFEDFMKMAVNHRYITMIVLGSVLAASFVLMVFGNKFILFPAEETEVYIVRIETDSNSTLKSTNRIINGLSQKINTELKDSVKWVVGRSGINQMGPTDPKGGVGTNKGLITIYVNDETKYNVKHYDFLDKLRKIDISEYKAKISFEALINGPPVGAPINATFRSNDTKRLDEYLNIVLGELKEVDGLYDLNIDDIIGPNEIKVELDYAKIAQLNLNEIMIGDTIRSAFSGKVLNNTTLENKNIDLHLRVDDLDRGSSQNLSKLNILDLRGNLIPLNELANLNEENGSVEIKRFDFKRSKTLTGQVEETKITSQKANNKLREIFEKYRSEYPEINLVFGGEEENTKESMQSLGQALIIALIAIFGLLVFMFNSFLRPFIIMSTIPLGLVGFSVAFYLHDRPGSFMAMIGLIGLAGIVVNSGIILISFIDEMRDKGEFDLNSILVKSSGMRLRAVLVTSLTTISGLLPTAYGIGGSDSMLVPMTMAMAWGLTSGTILTLIWIPCAYGIQEDIIGFFSRKKDVLNEKKSIA